MLGEERYFRFFVRSFCCTIAFINTFPGTEQT